MLMNWSSSYPYEETQINQMKRTTRQKITNPKQLEEEDHLADFNPPPRPELKQKAPEPQPEPLPEPIYDKPFEHVVDPYKSADSVLLEKLSYLAHLINLIP